MKRSFWLYACIIAASFAAVGLSWLIPISTYHGIYNETLLSIHVRSGASVLAGGAAMGAGIWFLASLKRYQAAFKTAYRLLTAGVLLFSAAILQLALLGAFNWWNTWYAVAGLEILPFIPAVIMIYVGVRKFSLLLRLKTKATSWPLTIVTAIVFTAFTVLIARHLARFPFDGVELYTGTIAFGLNYIVFSAIIARHIQKNIGQSYKDAMRWMTIALVSFALASIHEYFVILFVDSYGPYYLWGYQMIVWIITSFMYLEAARRFYLLTMPTEPQKLEETGIKVTDNDYIDSIIQVATLASRPNDVDPILDDLRLVTATHDETNLKLSEVERKKLLSVYERLEKYLLTDEPVRRFTREEIRKHTRPAFRPLLSSASPPRE